MHGLDFLIGGCASRNALNPSRSKWERAASFLTGSSGPASMSQLLVVLGASCAAVLRQKKRQLGRGGGCRPDTAEVDEDAGLFDCDIGGGLGQ